MMVTFKFLCLLVLFRVCHALNNGLGRTPQMGIKKIFRINSINVSSILGFNTWNHFCCNYTDKLIMRIADTFVSSGLAKAGYEYSLFIISFILQCLDCRILLLYNSVNLDDCWQVSRDANGTIQPDPVAFPNGIRPLADYMHTRKLKLGLYSGPIESH
jgi:alpha-galactosidase